MCFWHFLTLNDSPVCHWVPYRRWRWHFFCKALKLVDLECFFYYYFLTLSFTKFTFEKGQKILEVHRLSTRAWGTRAAAELKWLEKKNCFNFPLSSASPRGCHCTILCLSPAHTCYQPTGVRRTVFPRLHKTTTKITTTASPSSNGDEAETIRRHLGRARRQLRCPLPPFTPHTRRRHSFVAPRRSQWLNVAVAEQFSALCIPCRSSSFFFFFSLLLERLLRLSSLSLGCFDRTSADDLVALNKTGSIEADGFFWLYR